VIGWLLGCPGEDRPSLCLDTELMNGRCALSDCKCVASGGGAIQFYVRQPPLLRRKKWE
jgi:hypothetical protein